MAIAWKMYRSHNPSYLRFLRTSAERDADPGSVAVRANAEGERESTQVQSQMRHFPIEKGNTDMPLWRLPSPRSRPTGSRTALKPADDKARLMMSFKAECRGKRPKLKRQERECWPYLSTMAPQRHLCGAQTGRPRRWLIANRNDSLSIKCLLQWTEDSSSMLQNWVVLPKRDIPVGAGQAGV